MGNHGEKTTQQSHRFRRKTTNKCLLKEEDEYPVSFRRIFLSELPSVLKAPKLEAPILIWLCGKAEDGI